MPSTEAQRTVPTGAIATAMALIEGLNGPDEGRPQQEVVAEISALVDAWGRETITEAFGLIISTIMTVTKPADGDPDHLHTLVPAVLTRLRRMQMEEVPDEALPTVAGILTAASIDQDPYEWRTSLGPILPAEALVWCYTAWLLVDLADDAVFGGPGQFAQILTQIVGLDEPEDVDEHN